MEIGGGLGGAIGEVWGGPNIGYGIRDWLALEAGGDFTRNAGWGGCSMGYGGVRMTYAPRRYRKIHSALDGEFGVGMGAGGARCGGDGCEGPHFPFAFGGYTGIGYGLHLSFFSLFSRGRLQTTVADRIGGTFWGNINLGMQFRIAKHVDLYGGGGFAGYLNNRDTAYGLYYDVGVAVHFDPAARRNKVRRRGPPG